MHLISATLLLIKNNNNFNLIKMCVIARNKKILEGFEKLKRDSQILFYVLLVFRGKKILKKTTKILLKSCEKLIQF